MRTATTCCAVLLLSVAAAIGTPAQTSTIEGTIRSVAGPIQHAEVRIVETGQRDSTDARGHYRLADVAQQSVQLRVAFVGYVTLETGLLPLLPGKVLHFDLTLPPAPLIVCPPCDHYE